MSINDLTEKIKPFYTLILSIVVALIFFGFGRLSVLEERHTPIKIIQPSNAQSANAISAVSDSSIPQNTTNNAESGEVIGSKSGKKYYYPWCGTLKLVKPENRVVFASMELARQAGFLPAGNCKGLK